MPASHSPTPTPQLTGSVEQYQLFLPAMQAIAASRLRVFRANVASVVRNAARGVAAVLAHRDELAKMPYISIPAIESLGGMGEALVYATGVVDRYLPISSGTRAAIARAGQLRAKLLAKADVAVFDGTIPAAVVRGIRKGKGAVDTANDCIQLAALFMPNATAFGADVADLQEADTLGRMLIATLRNARDKKEPAPELVAAANARDRLWVLFDQTWEANVWRAGANLFLRDVEAHVPLLLSAPRAHRATKAPPAEPQPTQPPPAPTVLVTSA